MSYVNKGFRFEVSIEKFLNDLGIEAHRTNKANDDDLDQYKSGFDGGVDIIARYSDKAKERKEYTFYIQCKCHEKDLTKTAIAEVYTGMHVRKALGNTSFPVVIATADASQETRQYASELGVELLLQDEFDLIHQAERTKNMTYGNYGNLLKLIFYRITHNDIWLDTLPDVEYNIDDITITEKLLEESKIDFDNAQSHLDKARSWERKVAEERQKALDIQKVAVFRSLRANKLINCDAVENDVPADTDDSG